MLPLSVTRFINKNWTLLKSNSLLQLGMEMNNLHVSFENVYYIIVVTSCCVKNSINLQVLHHKMEFPIDFQTGVKQPNIIWRIRIHCVKLNVNWRQVRHVIQKYYIFCIIIFYICINLTFIAIDLLIY